MEISVVFFTSLSFPGRVDLVFTNPAFVSLAKDFPRDTLHRTEDGDMLETVTFRMTAQGAPGNSLCAAVMDRSRSRRSLSFGW